MGLHDAEEMLQAAQEQALIDERLLMARESEIASLERTIAALRSELVAAEQLIAEQTRRLHEHAEFTVRAGEAHGILWRERQALEQQLDAVRAAVRDTETMTLNPGAQDALSRIRTAVGAQQDVSADEHERGA